MTPWSIFRALEIVLRRIFDIQTTPSAAAARASVSERRPVAALVDVCLDDTFPDDRSGLELVACLRANTPEVPVIVMSALDDPRLPEQALLLGASEFVRKPVDVEYLMQVLEAAMRRNS